jgi:DHA2 family multidrug resistance protein
VSAVAEAAAAPPAASDAPDLTAWIAVAAGALGAFMAMLDISVTNSALPQIQGEIGATGTEGTWIGTGYLVAEIVMIPLTAWLTRVFGMRNLLLACGALFIAFSMLCGMADSLPMMILGRAGQGFAGGALIPTAQTIVATRLPRRLQIVGIALVALVGLAGPVIGPLAGGWLAENATWRWCFFINLPAGLGLIALLLIGLPRERGDLGLIGRADWPGILGLSVGLSALTVVLEEGQRERWFESAMIVELAIASALGLTVLLVSQFTSREPVVNLRLLRNRSYASTVLMITAVGVVNFGVIYLLPQFLGEISGYNAAQSGVIILLGGLPSFALVGVMPALMGRVDMRVLVGGGLAAMALGCFLDVGLTAQSAGADFTVSQLLRGAGQMLVMFSLNQASVGAVEPELAGDAAGLFNMARNLGGSMGLAVIGALIDRRTTAHAAALRDAVTANSPLAQERIAQMSGSFATAQGDAGHAQLQAVGQLAGEILRQATVMTFADAFWMQGVLLAACLPLLLIFTPPKTAGDLLGGH